MDVNIIHNKGEFDAMMNKAGSRLIVLLFDDTLRPMSAHLLSRFREMQKEWNVVYVRMNGTENSITSREYRVEYLPTFILIKEKIEAARTKEHFAEELMEELVELIEKHK